jgi:hypothetical protein
VFATPPKVRRALARSAPCQKLLHTEWKVSSPSQQMSVYAIEVARRGPDSAWGWLIGDPSTVGRRQEGSFTVPTIEGVRRGSD